MITLQRIKDIEKTLMQAHRYREFEISWLKRELKGVKRVISCDVDSRMVFCGLEFDAIWKKKPISDGMNVALIETSEKEREKQYQILGFSNDLDKTIKEFITGNSRTENIIRVKCYDKNLIPETNVRIIKYDFSRKPLHKEYIDGISEILYRLKDLFDKDCIKFADIPGLKESIKNEFDTITFEKSIEGKQAILDEDVDYSYLNALICFVWESNFVFGFVWENLFIDVFHLAQFPKFHQL